MLEASRDHQTPGRCNSEELEGQVCCSAPVARRAFDSETVSMSSESDRARTTARAELAATVFGAIIGGLCLSQFGIQPASATGAMLQKGLHYTRPLILPEGSDLRDDHLRLFVQFSVVLFAVASGTCVGRMCRLNQRFQPLTWLSVPAISVAGTFITALFLYHDWPLDYWHRTWLSALFASAVGILWGVMPNAQTTTARSALLKRAALGERWAAFQVLVFLLFVGLTVGAFHDLRPEQPSGLVGVALLAALLLVTSHLATLMYLEIPADGVGEPPMPTVAACYGSAAGFIISFVIAYFTS